jgi:hypothetical protein
VEDEEDGVEVIEDGMYSTKTEICDFRAISLLLSLVKRTSLMFVGNIAYTIFIWGQS